MMKLRLMLIALVFLGAAVEGEARTQEKASPTQVSPEDCELAGARIFDAADGGDAEGVRRLLSCGVSPDDKAKGTPLLVVAARAGHTEVARALLDAGASVERKDGNRYTALFFAARGGSVELVELLLGRGADVNALGHDDHTVLMFMMHGAIHAQLPPAVREILSRAQGEDDDLPLPKSHSSREDYRRVLHLLLAAGADVNAVADCGETALAFAPLTQDAEVVRTLLASGARVDYGVSPLCLAESTGRVMEEIVDDETFGRIDDEKLLKAAEREAAEWPALTAAARAEIIALLKASGATRHNCGDDEEGDDKE